MSLEKSEGKSIILSFSPPRYNYLKFPPRQILTQTPQALGNVLINLSVKTGLPGPVEALT